MVSSHAKYCTTGLNCYWLSKLGTCR